MININILKMVVLVSCLVVTSVAAQANPIEEERQRRLEILIGEITFLTQLCRHFLSENSAAASAAFVRSVNNRGYTTNGFSPLSSLYDGAGLTIEDFFFRTLTADDGDQCEVLVSYPEGEDTIVAQAFGQHILNLKPQTYKLINGSSWQYYTNADFEFAYRQDDGRPPPKTQTLVFEKLNR